MASHVVEGQLQTQSLSPGKREGLLELAPQRIKWEGRREGGGMKKNIPEI